MSDDLIARYGGPAPRYTSYPTTPHFHAGIESETYGRWLDALDAGARLSLYIHIPYCDRLCWFCGCHTRQTTRYEPVARYLGSLRNEIVAVARRLGGRGRITALHLGGGSPTLLRPDDLLSLGRLLRGAFVFATDAEISVEIDPNDVDEARLDGLAAFGLTRASLGVQDFDPEVQAAINRPQTVADTKRVVDGLRARGVGSVNLDVLYGLPLQTAEKLARTLDAVLSMHPDRIALFGYAHVPWVKKQQALIPEESLPGPVARFEQAQGAARRLLSAGYRAIGLDHFALPGDAMAEAAAGRTLRRNFQGYTTDAPDALIGFGASAIGRLPQGYVQNAISTAQYQREADGGGLATARGVALSDEDRVRGHVIETLMCDMAISFADLATRFGAEAGPVIQEARQLAESDGDGLLVLDADGLAVTERGRPFVRTLAAAFDAYLGTGATRHSIAV